MSQSPYRRNWARRLAGVVICFSPLAVAVSSFTYGVMHNGPWYTGMTAVVIGAAVAGVNFYLSVKRPFLFRSKEDPMAEFRYASLLPRLATLVVVFGVVFGFGSVGTAAAASLVLLLDPGGPLWFLATTWNDAAVWDS